MTLRTAVPDDVPAIAEVFIAARTTNLAFLNWEYPVAEIEALFANHVLPNAEVRVAEVEGRVAGIIAWTPGEIDHLYVHPDCQGRGVGTALLLEALKDCDPSVELWVFQKNRDAIRFYEKHGFRLLYETDGQESMEKEPDARYGREPSDSPSPSGKGG